MQWPLRRPRVQWRGMAWRAWPAVAFKAFKVCPLRAAPSARRAAPRRSSALPGCARRALAVHALARVGALMRLRAQWRGLVWRAWPAEAFKVCPLRTPLYTSPQLCTPWLRTPSACCARGGPSRVLMRRLAQLQGPTCRGGLAAAPRVCPLRIRPPPPLPSAAPRRASMLPECARPAPAVHVVGYRGP